MKGQFLGKKHKIQVENVKPHDLYFFYQFKKNFCIIKLDDMKKFIFH